jgi:hypothetical protein
VRLEHEARRRAREAEVDGAVRDRRLLADPGLEVRVRAAEAFGEAARDRSDLIVEVLVHP